MNETLILLSAIAAVRLLPEKEVKDRAWNGSSEAIIAICVGVGFALLGTFWFSLFHVVGDTLSSDLYDFCGSVSAMRGGELEQFSRDRSLAAGWLPAFFARSQGIANGLAISSVISLGVIGSGLYLWARSLSTRTAGFLAVIFGLSLAPVVLLGRTLTFYPEYVAVFTMASALTCLTISQRKPIYFLLCGISLGACLLIDLRGIVWAGPLLAVAILAAISQFSKRSLTLALFLIIPIWGSWFAGRHVYTSRSTSLEAQANPVRLYYEHGSPSSDAPLERLTSDTISFVWGRTSILTGPATLLNLFNDTAEVSPLMSEERVVAQGRNRHLSPLWLLGTISFIGALASVIRRPMYLVGLCLSSAPFIAVLYHASHLEFRHRFAASGLPVLAIFFGVAASWITRVSLPKVPIITRLAGKVKLLPSLRSFIIVGITAFSVIGIIPTVLGPKADWRIPFVADDELERMISAARNGTTLEVWGSQDCIDGLTEDMEEGRPVGASILSD